MSDAVSTKRSASAPWRRRVLAGRSHLSEPLYRSAYSLMTNTVATGGLGVIFWVVAARTYPEEVVGRDGILISSMITVASVSQLNVGTAILRFLPGAGRDRIPMLIGGYAVSVLGSVLTATAFVLVAPLLTDELDFFHTNWALPAMYVAAVALWSIFSLQDAALTALRQAPWVPLENTVFGALKIVGLPLLAGASVFATHGVFGAWAIPTLLIVPAVNFFLFRHIRRSRRSGQSSPDGHAPRRFPERGILKFLGQDYLGFLMAQVAISLMPIAVLATSGSADAGYFFIPLIVATTLDLLFLSAASALVVEGAFGERGIEVLTRMAIRRFIGMFVVISLVLALAAPLVLIPFGSDYVHESTAVFRLLLIASACRAVVLLFFAVDRVQRRGGRILAAQAALLSILTVSVVLLGPALGATGVALAWMLSNGVLAVAVSPVLLRLVKRGGGPTVETPPQFVR